MSRPIKWRRIAQMPNHSYFIPEGIDGKSLDENILKIEELEALRLKDLEGLDQENCASAMRVSRQTFQRIYNAGKTKVADSLINGKAIRIQGGNYTRNICLLVCENCGYEWENKVENLNDTKDISCPECGGQRVRCDSRAEAEYCDTACERPGMGRGRGMGQGQGRGRNRRNR